MRNLKIIPHTLISLSLVALINACGGQPFQEPQSPPSSPPNTSGGSSGNGGGNSGSPSQFTPAITFSFSVTGSGGALPAYTTPVINTDNILKIKITPGLSDRISIPTYSNFTANYECVTYTVTALGKSVTTEVLCPSQPDKPSSQIIDFSDRLGPGHGPVTVTVDRVRYDFYCLLWTQCQLEPFNPTCYYSFYPAAYSFYCPLRTTYRNHTVTGNLAIQVNGSSL
jgi:hypothetical protein